MNAFDLKVSHLEFRVETFDCCNRWSTGPMPRMNSRAQSGSLGTQFITGEDLLKANPDSAAADDESLLN